MQRNGLHQGQIIVLQTGLCTLILQSFSPPQCMENAMRESNPAIDKDPIQGKVEIIQLAAYRGYHDKRWQDGIVLPDRRCCFLLLR